MLIPQRTLSMKVNSLTDPSPSGELPVNSTPERSDVAPTAANGAPNGKSNKRGLRMMTLPINDRLARLKVATSLLLVLGTHCGCHVTQTASTGSHHGLLAPARIQFLQRQQNSQKPTHRLLPREFTEETNTELAHYESSPARPRWSQWLSRFRTTPRIPIPRSDLRQFNTQEVALNRARRSSAEF